MVEHSCPIRLPRLEVGLAAIDPVGQLRGHGPGEMLQRAVVRVPCGKDRRRPALKVPRAITFHWSQQVRGAHAALGVEHEDQAKGADLVVRKADARPLQQL